MENEVNQLKAQVAELRKQVSDMVAFMDILPYVIEMKDYAKARRLYEEDGSLHFSYFMRKEALESLGYRVVQTFRDFDLMVKDKVIDNKV